MIAALGAFLSAGCAGHKCCQSPAAKATAAELLRVDAAFAQTAKERSIGEAFRSYAAADATELPMGESPVHGREAIAQSFEKIPAGSLLWTPVAADIAHSGDLGYTWGTFSLQSKDADGKPQVTHGKYTTVWKKQPDGSWKFVMDIGNLSPSPQP